MKTFILFLLLPLYLFGFYQVSETQPCTIHIDGRYFIIETEHHIFVCEEIEHHPECKCGWSQGEYIVIDPLYFIQHE
jgi:hypothetical protein